MIFSFGTTLRTSRQVVGEPVLRRDRSGPAAGLVLVVVHHQQAVGVVGEELQVEVVVADGRVDVEPKMALLEVRVECRDRARCSRAGRRRGSPRGRAKAAVVRVGREKGIDLPEEVGARGVVLEEVADGGRNDALDRVVVVDEREDLGVDASSAMDAPTFCSRSTRWTPAAIDDREGPVVDV